MKTVYYKNAGDDVVRGIVKDTKFADIIMACGNLVKKP